MALPTLFFPVRIEVHTIVSRLRRSEGSRECSLSCGDEGLLLCFRQWYCSVWYGLTIPLASLYICKSGSARGGGVRGRRPTQLTIPP